MLERAAIRLRGEHNLANVLEAVAAVAALGLPVERVATEVLANFRGVPNRLEEVAAVGGVTFYNDSQGTTPIAVCMALQAFAATPPVLIAGGRAKVEDFSELGAAIAGAAKALITIGEASALLAAATRAADARFPIHHAETLPDAVRLGYTLAQPAGIVLLSPACASFDMFRNMEHRGEVFPGSRRGAERRLTTKPFGLAHGRGTKEYENFFDRIDRIARKSHLFVVFVVISSPPLRR